MSLIVALDQPHDLDPEALRALIGGKAASLALMANGLGLPVPPAFVVTTEACRRFFDGGWPAGLDAELREHMHRLEMAAGRRFGDPGDPLLVSVRSGAPVSMPGMMDTILNLGLDDSTTAGLAAVSGDAAFAEACRDRFIRSFQQIVGTPVVPDDPWAQLRAATEAVFRSWHSERARAYRQREGIPDDLGTAVTIQAMVFGNRDADSATGVLFTRDPATGAQVRYGDVLFGAQGDDVVAGTHRTEPIAALDERLPAAAAELHRHADAIERYYGDCADIEFTIEAGRLWMLQARVGKRSPQAALRMAIEMAEDPDFPLDRRGAVERVMGILIDPPRAGGRVDDRPVVATGFAASPGIASGEVATTCERAITAASAGRPVILVRPSTAPDDVSGMARSTGILTTTGGPASHAAVVARGWGIPAVVGASEVVIDGDEVRLGTVAVRDGDAITIDGTTGEIFLGLFEDGRSEVPEVATLRAWAAELAMDIPDRAGPATDDRIADLAPQGMTTEDPAMPMDDESVLRSLLIKGYVTPEALAESAGAETSATSERLDALAAAGDAEAAAGAFRLTETGRARAQALLVADREAWGADQAEAALDGFLALDRRMKEAVTAWQMRQQALNDHSDADYDGEVLGRLAGLHEDTLRWLEPLAAQLPRLAAYRRRLERAAAALAGGDHRFVASPRVDSYHGVWFELHEDLILLAGRRREEEVAAGRA